MRERTDCGSIRSVTAAGLTGGYLLRSDRHAAALQNSSILADNPDQEVELK